MLSRRRVPVPLEDHALVGRGDHRPLKLLIPSYPHTLPATASPSDRRAAAQRTHLVFAHQLFPIVPSLHIDSLPPDLFTRAYDAAYIRRAWMEHALHTYYTPYATVHRLCDAGYDDELGIFGRHLNPLRPVVDVCVATGMTQPLLHYVFIVALQFYLCRHRAFLRVRTDANAPFSDALPPFLLTIVPKIDCRHNPIYECEELTNENVERKVLELPFISFLYLLMRWMQKRYPRTAKLQYDVNIDSYKATAAPDPVRIFCFTKLCKNFDQGLGCMRFREVLPVGTAEAINKCLTHLKDTSQLTTPVGYRYIKFFQHPKSAKMRTLSFLPVQDAYIARFFCHSVFRPDKPALVLDHDDMQQSASELARRVVQKIMNFSPLSDYKNEAKKIAVYFSRLSDVKTVFPTDRYAKWRDYDGYMEAQARSRYMCYVHDDMVYAHVPILLAPDKPNGDMLIPTDDEADVRFITPEAWEWMTNVGRVYKDMDDIRAHCHAHQNQHITPWMESVLLRELEAPNDDPRNPYLFMRAIQWMSGEEEAGVATIVHTYGQTYDSIRASYDEHLDLRARNITAACAANPPIREQLVQAMNRWDKCSYPPPAVPTPVTDVASSYLWDCFFPFTKQVEFSDGKPWIEHFHATPVCPMVTRYLDTIGSFFNSKKVIAELNKAASHRTNLSLHHAIQLNLVRTHFDVTPEVRSVIDALLAGFSTEEDAALREVAKLYDYDVSQYRTVTDATFNHMHVIIARSVRSEVNRAAIIAQIRGHKVEFDRILEMERGAATTASTAASASASASAANASAASSSASSIQHRALAAASGCHNHPLSHIRIACEQPASVAVPSLSSPMPVNPHQQASAGPVAMDTGDTL